MSAQSTPERNRTRLMVAVAILIGAIMLLIATEFASVTGTNTGQPLDTGALEHAQNVEG